MKKLAIISTLLLSTLLLGGCSVNKSKPEAIDLNKPLDQQVKTKSKDAETNVEAASPTEVKLEKGIAVEDKLDAEIAKEKTPLSESDDLDTLDKELNDTRILDEDLSEL